MIAIIEGTQVYYRGSSLLIMTSSGVGYDVLVGSGFDFRANATIRLFCLHHHSESDQQDFLLGFVSPEARRLAQIVSESEGVGCKTAHALVAALGPHKIIQSTVNGDQAGLQIRGLGPKKAEAILRTLSKHVIELTTLVPIERQSQDALTIEAALKACLTGTKLATALAEARKIRANDATLIVSEVIRLSMMSVMGRAG